MIAESIFPADAPGALPPPSADVQALTGLGELARWNVATTVGVPTFVTYSFNTARASYDSTARPSFAIFDEIAKSHIRSALGVWEQSSGLRFLEVPEATGGQIRFNMYDMSGVLNSAGQQASGFAYFPQYASIPGGHAIRYNDIGGDVFLNANFYAADPFSLAPGQRGYSIVLHEIGHAIGFKHPFEGTPTITPSHDNGSYTILSYNRPNTTTMLGTVDVEAVQYYYGSAPATYSWDAGALRLTIVGGGGADILLGTELQDVLRGEGGSDRLNGGPGVDIVTFAGASAGVTVNLDLGVGAGGDAAGDIYANIENAVGTAFNDILVGKGNVINHLDGGAGDDIIYAEGLDTAIGGAGRDTLFAGSGGTVNLDLAVRGFETVWGSIVGDVFNGATATANLVMIGQGGGDQMTGGAGSDFFYFDNLDTISGGAGSDWAVATLSGAGVNLNLANAGIESAWGSIHADVLSGAGANGAVVLIGDVGDDSLTGGGAADFLYGFGDNDRIKGGLGNDQLSGNAGNDVFVYDSSASTWGVDTIWDFVRGADRINLAGSGFTSFGQLSIATSGAHSIVNGGNGGQIWVLNNATLGAGDFLFA